MQRVTLPSLLATTFFTVLALPAAHAQDADVDMIYSYEDAIDTQPEDVANAAGSFESAPFTTTDAASFEQTTIDYGVGGPVETELEGENVAALDHHDSTYGQEATNIAAGANRWDISLGLALATIPEYVGANDNNFYVFPFIRAQYSIDAKNKLFFSPYEGLGFKHLLNDSWQMGVRTNIRNDRDSSDDASLAGMPDIDVAFEAGPFVRYTYDRLTLGVDVLTDISGEHDGYAVEASAKLNVPTPMNRLKASVGVEAMYADDDFMNHYFRVSNAQATATRRAFNPGSGFASVGANGTLTYIVDEHWFVTGNLGVTGLTGDAADSPLTREDTNMSAFLATGYRF